MCKYRKCEYDGDKMIVICKFNENITFEIDWYATCNNFCKT